MTNIFISYNRKSEAITKALANDFEALGHTVWFDQELSGGQAWWEQILAMVRNCDLFVFILEPEALNSTACKREYGYAVDIGKPILPVLVSEGVPLNRLPPALSQIQFVDYRKQDRDAAFRLARAISAAPQPKPLPDPLPPAPDAPISYLGTLTTRVETTSSQTYEQQSALVFDLKRSLREPGNENDVRALLEKMRRRHDLFANVADEIDEILENARKAPPPVRAPEITPPSPKQPPKETLSILAEYEPPEKQESQRSSAQELARTYTDHEPTRQDRKGIYLLAATGVVVGILGGVIYSYRVGAGIGSQLGNVTWYLFPVGGAIAGVIAKTNQSAIIAALVGMILALLFVSTSPVPYRLEFALIALVSSPLAALAARYITKRQG